MARTRPEAVPRCATERNPQRETTGGRVANVSAKMGAAFMPWQRAAADVLREIDPETGGPWYTEGLIVVSRQQGKTILVRADMTDTCLFKPAAQVRYTAQNRLMALHRLETDFWRPIHDSPLSAFLDHSVGKRKPSTGLSGKTGSEHIEFANRSRWSIDSVKSTSGHGPSLDKGVIDEAFAHRDGAVEAAMSPAMIAVPDAQLVIASAVGNHLSTYLRAKLDAARARAEVEAAKPLRERRSRMFLLEYSAPEGADRYDPDVWWQTLPALGWTITEAKIAASQESMASEPEEWDRAYLGWWPAKKAPDPVIPVMSWNDNGIDAAAADWQGVPIWSVDVAPERDWSSIGYSAKIPGARAWLEVVAHEPGTNWVGPHMDKLRSQFGGDVVVIDGAGAAGALERDLIDRGFIVRRLSLREKVDACGAFYDDAIVTMLRHRRDPVLDAALASAVKRRIADGDAWLFSRGRSLADISALYTVVLARYVLIETLGDDYDPLDSVY